jgi:hypothetical protein
MQATMKGQQKVMVALWPSVGGLKVQRLADASARPNEAQKVWSILLPAQGSILWPVQNPVALEASVATRCSPPKWYVKVGKQLEHGTAYSPL